MEEESIEQFKQAVEFQHGGRATLAAIDPVKELFEGKVVWRGKVHTFDLKGCPNATRAYAWSSPIEGGSTRRFFAVLHSQACSRTFLWREIRGTIVESKQGLKKLAKILGA
jgi:hypothetical protein